MVWAAIFLPLTMLPRDAAIDFSAKATGVGALLERLSTQTGAHLKASPSLAGEIVFVRAKGVELSELKSHIAHVLVAEWVKKGDTEFLSRPPALERQIWLSHVAYRRRLVDEALNSARERVAKKFDAHALAADLAALPPLDDNEDRATATKRYQAETDLFAQGPMARLLDRLVLSCDPNDLAAIGPYERKVFRINPTPMQVQFDRDRYASAVADFATEQQAWIEEAAKVNFGEGRDARMVSDPRDQLHVLPRMPAVSIEVKRGEMTALFNVNLTNEGDQAGFGIISQTSFADPGRAFLNAQMNPATPAKDDPLVALSDDSVEFDSRVKDVFGGGQGKSSNAKMLGLMTGLEKNDPLAWTVSDTLNGYADLKSENIVAAVPDSALTIAMFLAMSQPAHVQALIRAFQDSGTLELHEKGGWAELNPTDRYEAALDFTPRAAAATLMKSVISVGRMDIHDYAKYAFESKRLNRGGVGDWFLAIFDRSVLGASDQTDWKTLQLYGSFERQQQRQLESGARFAYAGMNQDQKKIVERIMYAGRIFGGRESIEPTEEFPAGLPATCTVVASVQTTSVIVAYARGADGETKPSRSLDPYTLASVETDVVGDPAKMSQYGVAGLAGYWPGANKVLNLRVEGSPKVVVQSKITVPDFDQKATPVAWEKLPDPFPKQIADAMAQLKANKAGQPKKVIPPVAAILGRMGELVNSVNR